MLPGDAIILTSRTDGSDICVFALRKSLPSPIPHPGIGPSSHR